MQRKMREIVKSLWEIKPGDVIVMRVLAGVAGEKFPEHTTIGIVERTRNDGDEIEVWLERIIWCSLRNWRKWMEQKRRPVNLDVSWLIGYEGISDACFFKKEILKEGERKAVKRIRLLAEL